VSFDFDSRLSARQLQSEPGTNSERALYGKLSVHSAREVATDGQAQSDAAATIG